MNRFNCEGQKIKTNCVFKARNKKVTAWAWGSVEGARPCARAQETESLRETKEKNKRKKGKKGKKKEEEYITSFA